MGNFITIHFQTTSKNDVEIKMEDQCSFENNGKIYRVDKNKINIFDKQKKTWTSAESGSKFRINDYQLQTIEAFANNYKEKNVEGEIVLSQKDIREGMRLYTEGGFRDDLNKELKGEYEAGKSWLFNSFQAIASYINNKNPKNSGNLVFSIGSKQNSENVSGIARECFDSWNETIEQPKQDKKDSKTEELKVPQPQNQKLFSHPAVKVQKSFIYKFKEGDALCTIAREYGIDTYTLIKANPQLKEGKDYKILYTDNGLSDCLDWIKSGTKIIIPERYHVKPGSAKNLDDVAKITGISKSYLQDLLTVTEVDPDHPGKPNTTCYPDGKWVFCDSKGRPLHKGVRKTPPAGTRPAKAIGKGFPTIGFGHAGRLDGKRLILPKWNAKKQCFEGGTKITHQQAYDILCNDILEHNQRGVAYFGRSYEDAPVSVRSAIFDLIYNKGIYNGFLHPKRNDRTQFVKRDLENKKYATALADTRWLHTGYNELKRRNVYRFISGLTDLSADKRQAAMKSYEPYYKSVLNAQKGADKEFLQIAWKNAAQGKTTNFKMKIAQKDR